MAAASGTIPINDDDDDRNDPLTGDVWEDPVLASDGHRYSLPFLRSSFAASGGRSPITQSLLRPVAVRHAALRHLMRLPQAKKPLAWLGRISQDLVPHAVLPINIESLPLSLQASWLSSVPPATLSCGTVSLAIPVDVRTSYKGGFLHGLRFDSPRTWRERSVAAASGTGLLALLADPTTLGAAQLVSSGKTVEEIELEETHPSRKYADHVLRAGDHADHSDT